jgi:ADP-ribosylation factor protein 1
MTTIFGHISSFLHHLTGRNVEPKKLLVLGLDAAGKTTFLYKLRSLEAGILGPAEVVTTIPTIGFNVETLILKNNSLKCWDMGGCSKIRPLWRHYMQDTGGIIFVVDSNDRDRVSEAKTELDLFLREEELAGVPLLVVGNKCDLPDVMSHAEVIGRLELEAIRGRDWHVIRTCMTTGEGLTEIVSWIRACSVRRAGDTAGSSTFPFPGSPPPDTPASRVQGNLIAEKKQIAEAKVDTDRKQQKMAATDWVERADSPEEEFLALLESYQLDVWDHYTHVRIAWVLISRHGIKEGFNKVAEAIQGYIAHSARADGKSYHASMTRFWCHMIAYCMHLASWQTLQDAAALSFKTFIATVCRENSSVGSIALWDKTLFKRYYTSAVMFSPRARGEVVSPDVLALPDLVPVFNSAMLGGASAAIDIAFLKENTYWQLGAL